MDITIKKIKVSKGKLAFDYDKKEDENSPISSHTSKFEEAPDPEFWRILGLLKIDICKILEIDPGQFAERIIPTGVSYSTDSSGYDGAIITCEYRMPNSGTTTTINTPLFKFPETGGQKVMPVYFDDETVNHLVDLQEEAIRYLEGHRGQGTLFDSFADDADEPEPRNATPDDSSARIVSMRRSGNNMKQIAG